MTERPLAFWSRLAAVAAVVAVSARHITGRFERTGKVELEAPVPGAEE